MGGCALLLASLAACGCTPLDVPLTEILPRHRMSPQAVALDILSVSPRDEETAESIWRQVDEQQLGADERRRLEQAGFRVGLISGQMPVELERALGITATPDDPLLPQAIASDDETAAQVRHMQLRVGGDHHGTILAGGAHEELPLLTTRQGQGGPELSGQTYRQAQGEFRVAARQLDDGRVSLELTPELVHGDVAMQYTATDGVLRPQPGRPRLTFDDLKCAMPLSAGQMLVIGPAAGRRGALGQAFLSQEVSGRPRQKLLVVRLAQTQYDALFNAEIPAAPDAPVVGDPKREEAEEIPSAEVLNDLPTSSEAMETP